MNKKKSARLWTIAILKNLLMIRWDILWQYRNHILHSPNGPTSIASHRYLIHKISAEKYRGTDGMDQSNYNLFSTQYTITKLQSSSINNKKLWLKSVHLARK